MKKSAFNIPGNNKFLNYNPKKICFSFSLIFEGDKAIKVRYEWSSSLKIYYLKRVFVF